VIRALATLLYLLSALALMATVAPWAALLISGCWGVALVAAFPRGGTS
jgi:hypothetical protein